MMCGLIDFIFYLPIWIDLRWFLRKTIYLWNTFNSLLCTVTLRQHALCRLNYKSIQVYASCVHCVSVCRGRSVHNSESLLAHRLRNLVKKNCIINRNKTFWLKAGGSQSLLAKRQYSRHRITVNWFAVLFVFRKLFRFLLYAHVVQ